MAEKILGLRMALRGGLQRFAACCIQCHVRMQFARLRTAGCVNNRAVVVAMRDTVLRFRVALALSLCGLAAPAFAGHLEIQLGRSYMDRYAASSVFVENVFTARQIGDSRFSWSPDVSLGWVDGRNIPRLHGGRYDPRTAIWLLAGGVRLHYGDAGDWYQPLFFSFQPAVASGRTQALSSPYQFVSTLGWQGRRFSFQIRHISNGDLHGPNRGETMALVGVGFDL